jgi:serine phosphatase RsbU (regulator of sigma subunit)
VLFTDGVVDETSLKGMKAEDLMEVVRGERGRRAPDVAQALKRAVLDYAGDQPLADDSTLLLVRFE